jgi:hypothetical protein
MPRSAGHWLIYVLTTEGSYLQNLERPASGAPDTMQYWISGPLAWDIRTFSIDKDLRILELDLSSFEDNPVARLNDIATKTYGEILAETHRIEVPEGATDGDLIRLVQEEGLFPQASWTVLDFPLWLPENTEYASREP